MAAPDQMIDAIGLDLRAVEDEIGDLPLYVTEIDAGRATLEDSDSWAVEWWGDTMGRMLSLLELDQAGRLARDQAARFARILRALRDSLPLVMWLRFSVPEPLLRAMARLKEAA
jgi:hypothetical protein